MPQPYDYTLNAPNPAASVMAGFQTGLQMDALQAQRAAEERMRVRAEQQAADMEDISQNPTSANFVKMITKYPELATKYKTAYDIMDTEKQRGAVSQASQVYAALQANAPDTAIQLLTDQAEAARNSGDEESAKKAELMAGVIKEAPEAARTSAGMFLASAMGGDKFAETFTKLESERRDAAKAPAELTEAQAKANKAAVESKYAESNAVKELEKKGWDITKIQNDISIGRENTRIAAMNAALTREKNELKREELQTKIDDALIKRDEKVSEKAASVESARSSIDNFLGTADRIIQTPAGVVSDATGPISQKLPTLSQDVADFEELVGTFDAQAFISQIPAMKGSGALSDAEGKKLTAALQSFSLRQSPQRLMSNVKEAQRIMLKARENLSTKYGVPDTIPDTPAVEPAAGEIDALLQKYGGQ